MGLRTSARTLAAVGIALALVAGPARATRPPSGDARGPFEAELARESVRLADRFGHPEAIAPLAAVAALDDSVPAAALELALRQAAGAGADPLVAAQAAFQLARLLEQRGD